MKDNSLNIVGGTGAMLAGVAYILVGLAFFLDSTESASSAAEFLTRFAENPAMHLLGHWAFGMAGIFMLAAVPALSEPVRRINEGWVRWTTTLAIIGFALTAVGNFRAAANELIGARALMSGDAMARTAIVEAVRLGYLDPQGWFQFGAVGVWFLVISLLAQRNALWPRPLVFLGIASAVLYWFVPLGRVLELELLNALAAGLGGVVIGPIWLIWLGIRLRGEAVYDQALSREAIS